MLQLKELVDELFPDRELQWRRSRTDASAVQQNGAVLAEAACQRTKRKTMDIAGCVEEPVSAQTASGQSEGMRPGTDRHYHKCYPVCVIIQKPSAVPAGIFIIDMQLTLVPYVGLADDEEAAEQPSEEQDPTTPQTPAAAIQSRLHSNVTHFG